MAGRSMTLKMARLICVINRASRTSSSVPGIASQLLRSVRLTRSNGDAIVYDPVVRHLTSCGGRTFGKPALVSIKVRPARVGLLEDRKRSAFAYAACRGA